MYIYIYIYIYISHNVTSASSSAESGRRDAKRCDVVWCDVTSLHRMPYHAMS